MAANATAPVDIVAEAGNLLGERLGDDWTHLDSESTVLRARTTSGSPLIIKHVTDTGFDEPDHDGAPQRFLNEWAGLEFLCEVEAMDVAPKVVAASPSVGLLILEDLGNHPNLESVLLTGGRQQAKSGMELFGAALGRLHGASIGREEEFRAIQDRIGTGSPRSDTTVDQRTRRDLFAACFDSAGHRLTEGLWKSIVQIEEMVHGQSPFRVLAHADSGPQNFLLSPEGGRLIDFEYCVYRSGLTDVAGARLGFPQTASSMEVPTADVDLFELAYRRSVVSRLPESSDDVVFDRALGAACGHWSLNRVAAAWLLHVEPRLETRGDLPESEADRLAKLSLAVDGFAALAESRGVFGELASVLQNCVVEWRRLWPEIGKVGVYPALRNGVPSTSV